GAVGETGGLAGGRSGWPPGWPIPATSESGPFPLQRGEDHVDVVVGGFPGLAREAAVPVPEHAVAVGRGVQRAVVGRGTGEVEPAGRVVSGVRVVRGHVDPSRADADGMVETRFLPTAGALV